MNELETAYAEFIQHHLDNRTGERRGRLERGHKHAESLFAKNIWWPLKRNFDNLHPEYEVMDWRNRSYFADFVYSPWLWRILIEIKGYAEHVTNMDRQKYCNELNRETFLTAMGYHVISFAYDDVANRPEMCIFLLRTILSRFEGVHQRTEPEPYVDREIVRLAVFLARPIRPIDVSTSFEVDHRTAVKYLQRLCQKGWLKPILRGSRQRVLYYELTKLGYDIGLL